MNRNKSVHMMVLSAMLIAVGIIIPAFSPIRFVLEPASYTLASHVAIILAMFISPQAAINVSLGTTLGFFLGGFPITVVVRAFSHIVFATLGAMYLRKHQDLFTSMKKTFVFIFIIGLLHAAGEIISILPFYISGELSSAGFLFNVLVLVGIGTIIHSSIDFVLSLAVWKVLVNIPSISTVANVKNVSLSMLVKQLS